MFYRQQVSFSFSVFPSKIVSFVDKECINLSKYKTNQKVSIKTQLIIGFYNFQLILYKWIVFQPQDNHFHSNIVFKLLIFVKGCIKISKYDTNQRVSIQNKDLMVFSSLPRFFINKWCFGLKITAFHSTYFLYTCYVCYTIHQHIKVGYKSKNLNWNIDLD